MMDDTDDFDVEEAFGKEIHMVVMLHRHCEAIKQGLKDEFPKMQITKADASVYPEEKRWEIAVDVLQDAHEYSIVITAHDPERTKSPYKAGDGVDVCVTAKGIEVLLAIMHEGTVGIQVGIPPTMRPNERLVVAAAVQLCAFTAAIITGKKAHELVFIEAVNTSLRRELKKRAERN
jgi:hypothetical protein